jgi:predicted HTH transcriptional regulator
MLKRGAGQWNSIKARMSAMRSLNELGSYREGNRLEAKSAAGGLPKSMWETYSAFANTKGGVILLGVAEREDGSLYALGLKNPENFVAEIWNAVNNPQKVSVSILLDKHVRIEDVDGKKIIAVEVSRADKSLRPVFINHNPMTGTYRRNGEGDYHCPPEAIRAMYRDSGEKTQDMLVLDKMPLKAFDYESLRRFRNRMRDTRPGHVWSGLEDIEFLQKLGAIGVGEDEKLHPTAAGLLMFGFEHEILREYPQYFLDYQERYDLDVRWTDRVTSSSGEWSGNLFDFYFKAFNKLAQNPKIKVPFKMEGIIRVDDTPVHKALREALANCVTNADFYGERGLVIRNNIDEIIFENPGSFRITMGEALSGGVSSPRNAVILKMFNLLDIGERTGSGIPLIFKSWADEGYSKPRYAERLSPDRSALTLPLSQAAGEKVAIKSSDRQKLAIKGCDKQKAAISDKQKLAISDKRRQEIIAHLTACGVCKASELAGLLGITSAWVRVLLSKLIRDGIIVAEGANRNRAYRLK